MKLLDLKVDKKLHFLACYSLTLTLLPILGWYAVLLTMLVAIGKEVYDWFTYGSTLGWSLFWADSRGDLIADAIGIGGGLIVWLILSRCI